MTAKKFRISEPGQQALKRIKSGSDRYRMTYDSEVIATALLTLERVLIEAPDLIANLDRLGSGYVISNSESDGVVPITRKQKEPEQKVEPVVDSLPEPKIESKEYTTPATSQSGFDDDLW